jgi:putative ABC transport system permease protein
MLLSPRWRKVLRDLWSNKSRTILVIMSIAIGVFAFGGLFTARTLITASLEVDFAASNPSDIDLTLSDIDDLLVQYVERQPYVTGVQTYTTRTADIMIDGVAKITQLIAFEDFNNIAINQVSYEAGADALGRNEIILERSFLDDLNLQIGDTLTVRTFDDKFFDLLLVGTVHSLAIEPSTITLPAWVTPRTLFNMGLSAEENQMELTVIRQTDPDAFNVPPLQDIATAIREDLGENGITVFSMGVNEDGAFWATDILGAVILVLVSIGVISLFLSGFLVINTIQGIMAAQKKQIGIMKIIGAERSQIIAIYLVMVAIFGLIAFIIAVPISMWLAEGILSFFGNFLNYNTPEIYIPTHILLIEFAVAILVPVLSALVPILNGTALTPAAAISDNVSASGTNFFDNLLIKLGGLSRPLLVAIRNTFRKKTRLAITLFTLTFAGTVFISMLNVRNGLLANIDELLNMAQFDISVTLGQRYNYDALEKRLESPIIKDIEGWINTSVVRERPNFTDSPNYTLIGMYADSPFVKPKMEQGEWLPPYSLENRYNVVIPASMLDDEPDLTVGGTVKFKVGDREQDWTIVGILETNGQAASDLYAYYDSVARFNNTPDVVNSVLINVVDTIPVSELQAISDDLTDYLEDRNFDVANIFLTSEIVAQITTGFNSLVTMLLGMAVLVAIVAGLGLTGTMSLNVLERTREIGVMRAVGAGSMSIRLIFVGEGVMIGVISFIIALPLSIVGTFAFSTMIGTALFGDSLPIIFTPAGIFVWLAIVLSVSSLASITPANRASQISIREAISYE